MYRMVASFLMLPCVVWALSPSYKGLSDRVIEAVASRYGSEAGVRVSRWRDLLISLSNEKEDEQKLPASNDFFNAIPWVFDPEHWGVEDYWATPIEMLATNGGDCEDFSIAKYFTLKETGVDISKLRITYVKALDYNLAHMVLAYYAEPDGEPVILDNIKGEILPASKRTDLLPVYSFNGDGLWSARARSQGIKGSPMKSLPQWRNMHERIEKELGG